MESRQNRYPIYPLELLVPSTRAMCSLFCRSCEQALRALDTSCVPSKAFSIRQILREPQFYLWRVSTWYAIRSPRTLLSLIGSQVTNAIRGMRAFQVPPSWEAAFSISPLSSPHKATSLSEPPVLLVKGRKNSGKSTFARSLANRLCSGYAAKHSRDPR